MKSIVIVILFILSAKITIAQKELLSLDEHSRYIYYQVIDMPGLSADTLSNRGAYLIKREYPKANVKAVADKITGEGQFATYSSGGLVVKHESGKITYRIAIEFKDNKYRYWLTDFVFTPNKRDRYGNYVLEQGMDTPLEKAKEKLMEKDAESYFLQTGAFCNQLGDRLKLYMINAAPKKTETIKKIVTDKW
jgi:hypothetical protein